MRLRDTFGVRNIDRNHACEALARGADSFQTGIG
jgi:hypothetical protein